MEKSWMPITAGILDLIGGLFQLGASMFFAHAFFDAFTGGGGDIHVVRPLAILFGPLALSGIMVIIGGIFALKRERWKLALIGSLLVFLPWIATFIWGFEYYIENFSQFIYNNRFFLILGVAAPVLTILSKKQFH